MLRKFHTLIYLILLLSFFQPIKGQFVREYEYGYDRETLRDLLQTSDGGFLMAGKVMDESQLPFKFNMHLSKTDAYGDTLWTRLYGVIGQFGIGSYRGRRVMQHPDGGFVFGGIIRAAGLPNVDGSLAIIKTDSLGQQLWEKKTFLRPYVDVESEVDFILTADGGIAACAAVFESSALDQTDALIVRMDALGDTIWSRSWGGIGYQHPKAIAQTSDGGFLVCSADVDSSASPEFPRRFLLTGFDSTGSLLWNQPYWVDNELFGVTDMTLMEDGRVAVVGMERDSLNLQDVYPSLNVFDSLGILLFTQRYHQSAVASFKGQLYAVSPTPDHGLVMTGTCGPNRDSVFTVKADSLGNMEWESIVKLRASQSLREAGYAVRPTSSGGYAVGAMIEEINAALIVMDSAGTVQTNNIQGRVFQDNNSNCLEDNGEASFSSVLVRFHEPNIGTDFYALTDSIGAYEISLWQGDYLAEIVPPSMYHQVLCPIPDTLHLGQNGQDTIDFPMEITALCTYNEISISSTPLSFNVPTGFAIHACNHGSIPSLSTTVVLELDSALAFVSASLAPSQINGQVVTFDLDTLDISECVDIYFQAQIDTLSFPGATHCVEAHIFPDTFCVQPAWAGARLEVSAACQNDSVLFSLTNTGNPMGSSLNTRVYIDDVIFRTVPVQLNQNDTFTIVEPADTGATYLIEVPQEAGYPPYLGDSLAIAFVEGCLPYPDGSFHTGFVSQLYLGNSAPSQAILCQESVAAYDPNDKLAQPTGYGADHFLSPQTPIDYSIRFQNTGNDTARRVIILDTLSSFLDIQSIEFGASSHPFTPSIIGSNILRFKFQPILLPDSTTNEVASQGFVSFRIRPKAETPIGTLIENQAAIYFDFNPPVTTPPVFHTIGVDFVPWNLVSIEEVVPSSAVVQVWPNPVADQVRFQAETLHFQYMEVRVFDTNGRLVDQSHVRQTNELLLHPGNWAEGVYLYQVWGNGELVGKGKLLFQRQ